MNELVNYSMSSIRLQNSYCKTDPAFTMEAARALCERGVVKVGDGLYKFTTDGQLKHPSIASFFSIFQSKMILVSRACDQARYFFQPNMHDK